MIRDDVRVASVEVQMQEARHRCFGLVKTKEEVIKCFSVEMLKDFCFCS